MTTILIVDDNNDCIELAKIALNNFFDVKFTHVLTASTGEEAFLLYKYLLPAYILTDYHMPGICGEEFLDLVYSSELQRPLDSWIMSADSNLSSKYKVIPKNKLFFSKLNSYLPFEKRALLSE